MEILGIKIGCNVIILGTELGAATDLDGNYKIIKIPPGNYKIQVIMIGYAKTNISNVIVQCRHQHEGILQMRLNRILIRHKSDHALVGERPTCIR